MRRRRERSIEGLDYVSWSIGYAYARKKLMRDPLLENGVWNRFSFVYLEFSVDHTRGT